MTSLATGNAKQYGNSQNLAARARLASQYTVSDRPWFPWIASHLPLKAGDRIVDVGCGPAWFWEAVTDAVPRDLDLTLTDLSQGMVDEAMKRCAPLPFGSVNGGVADAAALPFEDERFDGVVAMHMLYHVADPVAAVADMFRILKPGGFLAVTTNGTNNMRRLYELTTTFGGTPYDPAAAAFGFTHAEALLQERFGNVKRYIHPAHMVVTDPNDVYLALTSFPPGDQAGEGQLSAFKEAIRSAFAEGGGVLKVQKESGLFLAVKD